MGGFSNYPGGGGMGALSSPLMQQIQQRRFAQNPSWLQTPTGPQAPLGAGLAAAAPQPAQASAPIPPAAPPVQPLATKLSGLNGPAMSAPNPIVPGSLSTVSGNAPQNGVADAPAQPLGPQAASNGVTTMPAAMSPASHLKQPAVQPDLSGAAPPAALGNLGAVGPKKPGQAATPPAGAPMGSVGMAGRLAGLNRMTA